MVPAGERATPRAYRYRNAGALSVATLALVAASGALCLVAGVSATFSALEAQPELPRWREIARSFGDLQREPVPSALRTKRE